MSDVISHKCPNCDGPLLFDPEKQSFHCEYCLSVFSETDITAAKTQEQHENLEEVKEQQFNLYHCPSCGGDVVTDDTTVATFCYYCHNPVVLTDRVSGDFLPNAILPFKISEESAREKFIEWTKQKKFIPKDFFSADQINKISGVYFPYWNIDAELNGSVTAKGTKIDIWRVGETEYTRTRLYDIKRNGKLSFKALLKNALSKNTRQKMIESVQPFPVDDVKDFHTQFLSGFQAEKRDIEFQSIQHDVDEELTNYSESLLLNNVTGYTSVTPKQRQATILSQSNKYLLLPLWVITYQDDKKKEPYYYAMNGATGKVGGILPINKTKLYSTAILAGSVIGGLLMVGGYFLF
ncbi:TFIIB-type zinc ribbon-containing protein [Vagococcus vulneris]|uniref:ATP-binding protein n=1 Tax=Vagococcus vulneris TaxID=1977869 RepID=A0A429ZXW2_9ENTE|nr:TFIIB-type zinc ribbon-containing protein [Vagococcus vulneris]RST98748.1 ATP-binding protein [Vagococcus vulneris]